MGAVAFVVEFDHGVFVEGDGAFHVENGFVALADAELFDHHQGRIEQADLIQHHAGVVGVGQRIAHARRGGVGGDRACQFGQRHAAHVGGGFGGRCLRRGGAGGLSAGEFHELRGHVELAVVGLDDGADVGLLIQAEVDFQRDAVATGAELEAGGNWRGVIVHHEGDRFYGAAACQLCIDFKGDRADVFWAVGSFDGDDAVAVEDRAVADDRRAQVVERGASDGGG